MKPIRLRENWLHHIVPLASTLVAVCVVVLVPFWAYSWTQLPFIGIYLEPIKIISALEGEDWFAKVAGVQSYVQLIAVDRKNVQNAAEVGQALAQNGYESVQRDLETRTENTYQVTVISRPFSIGELVSWFSVPFGLVFLGIGVWAYRMIKEPGTRFSGIYGSPQCWYQLW